MPSELAQESFRIRVVPSEPVWSLQQDDYAVKTNPIELESDREITVWLEPDLRQSRGRDHQGLRYTSQEAQGPWGGSPHGPFAVSSSLRGASEGAPAGVGHGWLTVLQVPSRGEPRLVAGVGRIVWWSSIFKPRLLRCRSRGEHHSAEDIANREIVQRGLRAIERAGREHVIAEAPVQKGPERPGPHAQMFGVPAADVAGWAADPREYDAALADGGVARTGAGCDDLSTISCPSVKGSVRSPRTSSLLPPPRSK